ncbi:MAG: alpha/beta hydrolase-fold protein [Candidatus Dormibacteraeota bacterium]|nr:alpha/beta hydrolase-fold protein [Candidatus Dormibacteraeota bacterium]
MEGSNQQAPLELTSPGELGAPWARPMQGQLLEFAIDSRVLTGNSLGDPARRPLYVYLPPAYGSDPGRRFPTIYVLQGMTGQLDMWRNRSAFRLTPMELYDQLFSDPATPPAILVFVDCWTSLGGSQFLDSPGTGRYHSYLCDEVVPAVDARLRTIADRDHRGVAGKSSGGYGAMVTPLLRPDLFSGLASHAGDAMFEFCYLPEFPETIRVLRDHYQGSFARFWEEFRARPGQSRPTDHTLVNSYCMAACYSAASDGTPEMPFSVETGEMIPAVWDRWLEWDPVRMVTARPDAASQLKAVYLDGGRSDEFHLEVGATAVRASLERVGVADIRLELFEGGHGGIEYRYPTGIRHLIEVFSRDL